MPQVTEHLKKDRKPRPFRIISAWIVISVISAVVYGIINDQVKISLSSEYFSVFKRQQFDPFLNMTGTSAAPVRTQALVVGTAATWWFGLLLGIALAIAGLGGGRPAIRTKDYMRVVLGIMAFSLALSAIGGLIGFVIEPLVKPTADDWPFLYGIHHIRATFAVGSWHDAAYFGGLVGTIIGFFYIRKLRSQKVALE